MKKIALVACSNGLNPDRKNEIEDLVEILKERQIQCIPGKYLFDREENLPGHGREKAMEMNEFYKDSQIQGIFDVSGGDLANEVLSYLDYPLIRENPKPFCGYSDLTTVLNSIYTKTSNCGILYQIRNVLRDSSGAQLKEFTDFILHSDEELFSFPYTYLQGEKMDGIVAGGNIRCLLKLAGTGFFPDFTGKILLLESMGGRVPQMVTYLNQLQQMGVFRKAAGIILGTFSVMEREACVPAMEKLVLSYADPHTPVIKTSRIGHGSDSKAVLIGKEYHL